MFLWVSEDGYEFELDLQGQLIHSNENPWNEKSRIFYVQILPSIWSLGDLTGSNYNLSDGDFRFDLLVVPIICLCEVSEG